MTMYINRTFHIGDEESSEIQGEEPATHRTVNPNEAIEHQVPRRTLPSNNTVRGSATGWLSRQLTSQCGCGNTFVVRAIGLVFPLLLGWLLLVELLGDEALPGGGLFKLLTLALFAQLVGEVVQLLGLPAILGMLLTGIAMRTGGLYSDSGVYQQIASTIREASLAIILVQAGLGMDPKALLQLSFTVVRLAVCPGIMEAATVAVTTHYILDYPWLWGFALGFLLCAISPAVVVPTLLKLKKEGYGENKGISTLVIAASSLDDVYAISVFSVCISIIFSTGGSLVSQILQGPLDLCVGLSVGTLWGLLCAFVPQMEDDYVVFKRAMMIGGGGLCAVLGGPTLGYPGAGSLFCITSAFIASIAWNLQGPSNTSAVDEVFSWMWTVTEPLLFALIGAEVDLRQLELGIVAWGVLIIVASLVVRVMTCSLVLVGGKLNYKEVAFVNLAWLPKATVQAALAPQALDMARKMAIPNVADLRRGGEVLTVAVLSILITAPLGSIGPLLAGPRLLAKTQPPSPAADDDYTNTSEDHHL